MTAPTRFLHLRSSSADVSVLLAVRDEQVDFLHWGPFLGDTIPDPSMFEHATPPSSFDGRVRQLLIPEAQEGWLATPALEVTRNGELLLPTLRVSNIDGKGDDKVTITQVDDSSALLLQTRVELTQAGVLEVQHTLHNLAETALGVTRVATILPLDGSTTEIVETTGRWVRETQPQRHPISYGKWSRVTRQGRPGHNSPVLFSVGTPGFGFREGRVRALHLAWSGDAEHFVEKHPAGHFVIGTHQVLQPGEIVLQAGEAYVSPVALATFGGAGLDSVAARHHQWARQQRPSKRAERLVTLNSWEAVYFNHDAEHLMAIADRAAYIGVERFVLDDGWFQGRRDDTRALGDWYVDRSVWPTGLSPLIEHVNDLGMEFGLWVEPEMISPDSELARSHPDWVSQVGDRAPRLWRHQQVLDLVEPDAWWHVYNRLHDLLSEYRIGYLKWDMNRDSTAIGHNAKPMGGAQVTAAYKLLDALQEAFPHVEIENCSSGGGRVDSGLLVRTDRVWPSDSNDPLERQTIQLWTGQLVPPELIGSHVGAATSHTTGRAHPLDFRIATALPFHFGIEWNLMEASSDELEELRHAVHIYKHLREEIRGGTFVRADLPTDRAYLYGIVSPDCSRAVFAYAQLHTDGDAVPHPVPLPGLADDQEYEVRVVYPAEVPALQNIAAQWVATGTKATGRFLRTYGLHLPPLFPGRALLMHVAESNKEKTST